MINFLHSYYPNPILISIGRIDIHWYGLLMSLSIAAAILLAIHLGKKKDIKADKIIDAAFWATIGGLIGARIYEIFLEWPYYSAHPERILKVWEGGLAIHGAIIGGAIALAILFWKEKSLFLKITGIFMPGLALGQAIGRWGNYFNQELFGRPSLLPWSIPIAAENRPDGFLNYQYFHPTFLYESIGNLLIAITLYIYVKRRGYKPTLAIAIYMLLYSLLRFSLEFIKIDQTPVVAGLRWPQIASLLMMITGLILLINSRHEKRKDIR